MKILIAGHRGQVGQFIQRIYPAAVCLESNLTDLTMQIEILRENPELIINCAAITDVDQCEENQADCMAVNCAAAIHMAEAAKECGAAFIHFSSDYVFDGESRIPYRPSDKTNPTSFYGRCKLMAETGIMAAHPDSIIIRTSWVFSQRRKNFMTTILKAASNTKRPLRVVADQWGLPTYAGHLAEAVYHIIERCNNSPKYMADMSGIYHLAGAGEPVSWYLYAKEILSQAAEAGIDVCTEIEPITSDEYVTKVKRPAYSVLDNSKFEAAFCYKSSIWKGCPHVHGKKVILGSVSLIGYHDNV